MNGICQETGLACMHSVCTKYTTICGHGLFVPNADGYIGAAYFPWELSQWEIDMLYKHGEKFKDLLNYKKQVLTFGSKRYSS